MVKTPVEMIHENAAAIRQMLKDVTTDHVQYNAVLSKEDSSPALLKAVNAVLREYKIEPVEKVSGYDLLTMDLVLQREKVCAKCTRPDACPFKGDKPILERTSTGIHATYVWCARYYRVHLMKEIEELAGKEVPGLEKYSLSDLEELRRQLKAKIGKKGGRA